MTSRIFVGLSGPTFFDYQNPARRTLNDLNSSPNPILENAFGLSLFYDEIWFLCESLCPQSLRGHSKIRYLDKYLSQPGQQKKSQLVSAALNQPSAVEPAGAHEVSRSNFDTYWDKVQHAGAYWWNDTGRRIDNHTHGLEILGCVTSGNSNRFSALETDLAIVKILKSEVRVVASLNSFTANIFDTVYPSQHHPATNAMSEAALGSAVINAMVPNCINSIGPDAEIFDRISSSLHAIQFRGYIRSKNLGDAFACYIEIVREIEDSIAAAVKNAALAVHPTRGIATILVESFHELLSTSLLAKLGAWYGGQVSPPPVAAAAFVLDVKRGIKQFIKPTPFAARLNSGVRRHP